MYDRKSLIEQLQEANVLTELGGALSYNHEHWVHNRLVSSKSETHGVIEVP